MAKTITAEVFGPDPPCHRCQLVHKTVEQAAAELKAQGLDIRVIRKPIMSREVVARYGVLVSPALAINGVVKMMGAVPTVKQARDLLQAAAKD